MKFSWVTILDGAVEFSIFLLIFERALQQCSATALPVICFSVSNFAQKLLNGLAWNVQGRSAMNKWLNSGG